MTFPSLLAFLNAILCLGLIVAGYAQERRSVVHRAFALGMLFLAFTEICVGMAALSGSNPFFWERVQMGFAAFLPGGWLLFSISFARPRNDWKQHKGSLVIAFAMPLFFALPPWSSVLIPVVFPENGVVARLGSAGYFFYLGLLLSSVLVLTRLEQTLRATAGIQRYRVKFMVVGVGVLFSALVYLASQALLLKAIRPESGVIRSVAVLAALLLIAGSLIRSRMEEGDLYISTGLAYRSVTLIVVGGYLVTVGLLARVIQAIGGNRLLPIGTLFIFLAVIGLTVVGLSSDLQQRVKRAVIRNLRRPRYDYCQEWSNFTRQTASLVDTHPLCAAICRMISGTCAAPSVTIWLIDDTEPQRLTLGGSTRWVERDMVKLAPFEAESQALVAYMKNCADPVDFRHSSEDDTRALFETHRAWFEMAKIDCCAALTVGGRTIGLLTLGGRAKDDLYLMEDLDLLKTLADQAAGNLLNARLSERLVATKEMETFQNLSAFFIHDLKNLASTLSLTMQNLPAHYNNPAFREDALLVIAQSVTKMNTLCGRLSTLGRLPTLACAEMDLNALMTDTLNTLHLSPLPVHLALGAIPWLTLDGEQMQKVVVNLILNARDAVVASGRSDGEIRVTTEVQAGWVVLTVSDNGCGIPQDFINRHLFQPLHTTKSEGLGIGLYHCKTIVEAHHGRIRAESREGEGAEFIVSLPIAPPRSSTAL